MRTNPVRDLWQAGKPAFGTWVTLCPHPRIVKMFASAGFDFVLLEMEHTDFSMGEIGALAMLAREAGLCPIVRPPGTLKPHDLTRPLDAGAMGLLLPSVETAEQMAAIVKATKYYPMGNRPMNLRGPHTDYRPGKPAEVIAHLNRETILVVMIESRLAIDNLEAILDVPGVDCIMIGPDDLSQDMGIPGELQHPDLHAAYDRIFAICNRRGIPCGLSAQSVEMAQGWLDKGARFVPFQNDAAMVWNAASTAAPKLKALAGR